MRAAASLLLLLGRLRASLARAGAGQLMDQVAQAIQQFEVDARAGGAPPDQVETAKYALAATADDIVQNLPTEDSRVWTQYSMLVRFFNERMGGVQVLPGARPRQAESGGQSRPARDHARMPQPRLRRRLSRHRRPGRACRAFAAISTRRSAAPSPKTIEDLSPHWRGQTIALAGSRFQVPVWSVAAAAGVILLGAYLVLRNMLAGQAEALALTMAQVHPDTRDFDRARNRRSSRRPTRVARSSTQLERIRAALAKEILAGKVDADQSATTIFIRIGNVVLFPSGGAKVNDSFAPIAAKIAAALDKEPGAIHVDGYTDTDPIHTLAFPSNFELSEARAKSVAAMLKPGLSHPERLAVSGKGAGNPVAAE